MHHALAASSYLTNAAYVQSELHSRNMRLGADLLQLPLAGIAPKRAHGPKRAGGVDPGGLWCFLNLGLDVRVDLGG